MTRSTCTIIDEEEVQEEAYSVSKGFRSSKFFKGESSSRYSIIDEEHKEAYSKGFKSSNFFIGESSSSSGLHQLQHEEKEVEEFNPSANNFNPSPNESSRFTSDLNEIPQYLIGSTRDKTCTNKLNPANNDGVKLKGCVIQPKLYTWSKRNRSNRIQKMNGRCKNNKRKIMRTSPILMSRKGSNKCHPTIIQKGLGSHLCGSMISLDEINLSSMDESKYN
ncbi:uncharacterized protein LOC123229177 isoform X2 [Mangifera indica]|uniref:uncharacterized protein LOC123229177 isoform X2 n=1 Tax=Mangifera indica TaxID=29780 RepID=UPI001CFA9F77|nr:uncharacterized protein LOC123229177 isoform X2 [Mangifera indica]